MFAMDMIKSLSSKPEEFTGDFFFVGNNIWGFWLTEIGLLFVVSKVTDSSITLIVSSTSSTDASYKDILCHGHILCAFSDNIYKILSFGYD